MRAAVGGVLAALLKVSRALSNPGNWQERLKRIYDKERVKEIAALRPITDFFPVIPRITPGASEAPAALLAGAPAAPSRGLRLRTETSRGV
eukprot:scaffold9498_cov66-Cyclotella_meneghiniana.AAC.1